MKGISWSPLSVGLPLLDAGIKANAGVGLQLAYAYMYSDTLLNTHFLRPRLSPGITIEILITKHFLVSTGWEAQVYIPQKVGGGIGEIEEISDSLWHIGQACFKFHYRFHYTVKM